jgi:hypothetical protein
MMEIIRKRKITTFMDVYLTKIKKKKNIIHVLLEKA